MASGLYSPRDVKLCPELPVKAGSVEVPISKTISLAKEDSYEFSIFFQVKDYGGTPAIVKLQEHAGNSNYVDIGEVTEVCITQDGTYAIKLSQGVQIEALVLPISNPIRAVIESAGTLTICEVWATKNAG